MNKRINECKSIKKKKNSSMLMKVLDIFLLMMFIVVSILLIINLIKLSNIENLLRIVICIIIGIILILLVIFRKKKKKLCRIIMILLSIIYIFLDYNFYRIYNSLENITSSTETKGLCLVTNLKDIDNINDMADDDIGVINKELDNSFYDMTKDILNNKKLSNQLVEYDGYIEIINALLEEEINYAFLPENYEVIYYAAYEETPRELDFKEIYNEQKQIESTSNVNTKLLDEPFTMLLMGTDALLDSYNADTLLVLTVNPKTLKTTMLSIPRDTYTTICTGGKHKINSSGWYGDTCVVKTIEKYLSINIDYYAKINFTGIVDLVDTLGGIEVDVPYALCEQNSKREFGKSTVYVEEGLQTLNGEQALALSRNRHYWKDICPKKYTTDGNRSDLTRGENQQLVIKAIISKLMQTRDLNKFYDILDTISENMTTNMSKDTILSFYNVGKEIFKRFNANDFDEVVNINRLTFKYYMTTIHINNLDLSTIVNYDESVKYVSNEMKKNLGLLKQDEAVKSMTFDINEEYNPNEVKFNKLTSNLKLLDSLVGKTLGEALSYCSKNGLTCTSKSSNSNLVVVSQSIAAKTDIATIKNKSITLGVKSAYIDEDDDKEDTEKENNTSSKEDISTNDKESNDSNKESNKDKENTKEETKKEDSTNIDTEKDNDKEEGNSNEE